MRGLTSAYALLLRTSSRVRSLGARRWGLVLVAAPLLVVALDAPVRAQDAYGCIDRLPDAAVSYRLRHVQTELDRARRVEMPWWIGWMAFNMANAVVGWVGFVVAEKPVVRDTWLVQAIGASSFVVPESFIPLVGVYSRHRLRRFPESTPEERRVKLREATRLLERSVLLTASQRGLSAHLAAAFYATASTLYVAYRHPTPSNARRISLIIQFTTTIGTAELTILSVPRRSERAWEDYRSFACSDPANGGALHPSEVDELIAPAPVSSRPRSGPPVHVGFALNSLFISGSF